MKLEDLTLDIESTLTSRPHRMKVFAAMLRHFGKDNSKPGGEPMPWSGGEPGGGGTGSGKRESDTYGDSSRSIKPPTLLD